MRTGWANRWSQIGVLSFTEVTSWGILYYAFPVFLAPMQRELHWSMTTLTGAYSLALLVSGFAGLFVGRWLDRARSPHALMALGAFLSVIGLGLWATVSTLASFYFLQPCLAPLSCVRRITPGAPGHSGNWCWPLSWGRRRSRRS